MSDQNPPSPEEIQKEFENFVKQKFGGSVQVMAVRQKGEEEDWEDLEAELSDEPKKFDFEFNYNPQEIKKYLDRFVIKQDDAKKVLATSVCDHYNYVYQCLEDPTKRDDHYFKQNVLLLGPTGVGKTYLIERIAKLIGVPFLKADATKFTEAGYVGANVEDLVRDLVHKANGDIEAAGFGIIYLDEADKLANKVKGAGKDVSGRGVQIGLLKLMEDTEVDLTVPHDMVSQMQALMEYQKSGKPKKKLLSTRHILFIVSGAFGGLEEIIAKRLNFRKIGLAEAADRGQKQLTSELFKQVSTKDLIDYGFEPEFVGRLPIRVQLEELGEKDLFEILKKSEGSLLGQYIDSFQAYGIELIFTDDGLGQMAHLAFQENTGARSLMTICERILRDFKFYLPGSKVKKLVVDKELVDNPELVLHRMMKNPDFFSENPILN